MKTRLTKLKTKFWRVRSIPTSLRRRILKSRVLYSTKRSLANHRVIKLFILAHWSVSH